MKHKHYTEIIAWANGKTVQAFDTALLTWVDLTIYIEPSWHSQIQYRIKPIENFTLNNDENINKYKIKELAEKAGFMDSWFSESGDDCETEIKAFAELIVKECAGLFINQRYMILDPLKPFAEERVRVLKHHDKESVSRILRHFGVE